MRGYLFKRLAQIVITFFLFLSAIFFLVDAQPGDYGNVFYSNPRLTPEQRQQLKANLGLDQPTWVRYTKWMSSFLQGDLGISFSNYPRPVIDVIAERAPRTIVLFMSATVVSFYFGFMAGKLLAWNRGGLVEYASTIGGVSLYTVFTPWFALIMIWVFAFRLGWFPIGKFIEPTAWIGAPTEVNDVFIRLIFTALIASVLLFTLLVSVGRLNTNQRRPATWIGMAVIAAGALIYWLNTGLGVYALDILWHLTLPIITLALISFAGSMLLTRNSMLETLREDYVLAARAKGISEKAIRDRHAARNAMLPVVTSFVFSLAFAIDGGVITETVFSWPGMGRTLLTAANAEDIPMVLGALVFTGTLALTAHLVADILYAYLDPRIRYA
ncbi:MAG: ABC transporter permease [Chloroflexi bacterium]|nr:MAG: ABC transporter permease [Chloroflexota bacterium]MBL1197090.1 ABC transporter permease [Chloroflexota bacterium]NOH14385.1 ABC transporter permease [Chloroflexota bacterium]